MFAARSLSEFWPQFGECSATLHSQAGAQMICLPELTGLRQDVDTLDDLKRVQDLGLGLHTATVLLTLVNSSSEAALARWP